MAMACLNLTMFIQDVIISPIISRFSPYLDFSYAKANNLLIANTTAERFIWLQLNQNFNLDDTLSIVSDV